MTADLVKRAENAGFKAIVLTVDAPYFGRRLDDIRNQFKLPNHLKMANFQGIASDKVNSSDGGSGINEYVASLFDQSLTWRDVAWLKSITKLPLILKGILHPEDAKLAVQHGASGIIVSNHGARQLDGVPASIDVLEMVVKAVNESDPNIEVYLDGGVRKGTDVLKALGFGAKMVMVGRPVIWGLAYNGKEGVSKTLSLLRSEFDLSMALSGCTSLDDIKGELIFKPKTEVMSRY